MTRLAALLLVCVGFVWPAAAEVRLALVIDQTNYQYTAELSRVMLASSEADQVQAALQDTGFSVTRRSDLTSEGLKSALDTFRLSLEEAGPQAIGFVYYTGHGTQHPQSRNSVLLGTEARLRGASDLAAYGISLETQKDAFAATGVKAIIMVFDACRNVAAVGGYKSGYKGISRVEAAADMLIAYSTDIDEVAAEGVYAPVLAEEIRRPGQTAETLFANVQRKVAEKTSRQQRPWFNPRLYNTVCLGGCAVQTLSAYQTAEPIDRALGSQIQSNFLLGQLAEDNGRNLDAMRFYKEACDDREMQACVNLAHLYSKSEPPTRDYDAARKFYEIACTNGHAPGCTGMGFLYHTGLGVVQDYAKATELYQLACQKNEPISCNNLGTIYSNGQGVAQDHAKALRLFERVCNGQVFIGCVNLGWHHQMGWGSAENVEIAREYYELACSAGETLACTYIGNLEAK